MSNMSCMREELLLDKEDDLFLFSSSSSFPLFPLYLFLLNKEKKAHQIHLQFPFTPFCLYLINFYDTANESILFSEYSDYGNMYEQFRMIMIVKRIKMVDNSWYELNDLINWKEPIKYVIVFGQKYLHLFYWKSRKKANFE